MRKDEFLILMESLKAVFPEKIPNEKGFNLYWEFLKNHETQEVKNAVMSLIAKRKTPNFPRIAEIIEMMRNKGLTEEEIKEKAERAYELAIEKAKRAGIYQSIKFDDPIIHNVIVSGWGGWTGFIESEEDERFEKLKFIELYRRFFIHGYKPIEYLEGWAERTNRQIGWSNEKIVEAYGETTFLPPEIEIKIKKTLKGGQNE